MNRELGTVGLDNELSLISTHYDTIYAIENEVETKMACIKVNSSYGKAILNKDDLVKIRDWAMLNIEGWDIA